MGKYTGTVTKTESPRSVRNCSPTELRTSTPRPPRFPPPPARNCPPSGDAFPMNVFRRRSRSFVRGPSGAAVQRGLVSLRRATRRRWENIQGRSLKPNRPARFGIARQPNYERPLRAPPVSAPARSELPAERRRFPDERLPSPMCKFSGCLRPPWRSLARRWRPGVSLRLMSRSPASLRRDSKSFFSGTTTASTTTAGRRAATMAAGARPWVISGGSASGRFGRASPPIHRRRRRGEREIRRCPSSARRRSRRRSRTTAPGLPGGATRPRGGGGGTTLG